MTDHSEDSKGATYKAAGVDIEAGAKAVELMREAIERTRRPGVLSSIGGFSGLFELPKNYTHPVLVSGTDGVGTKLKIAQMMGVHDTIGIDLVAMCVNDVIVAGAEPLFFLDYLAVGVLEPEQAAEIVRGIAEGCEQAGCALIGGETAEMPGFYAPNEYDVAGFAVGVVERDRIIDGSDIKPGDVIIGLASNGVHSNGFSLVRKVFFDDASLAIDEYLPQLNQRLGDELLRPTSIYVKPLRTAIDAVKVKGAAHITGGGLTENIPRVLPENLCAELQKDVWVKPDIFSVIQDLGGIDDAEMYATFNMGIGMVVVVDENDSQTALSALGESGVEALIIGRTIEDKRGTIYV